MVSKSKEDWAFIDLLICLSEAPYIISLTYEVSNKFKNLASGKNKNQTEGQNWTFPRSDYLISPTFFATHECV